MRGGQAREEASLRARNLVGTGHRCTTLTMLSARAFARMANCSSQAVDKAVRDGLLTRGPDGLDPQHPNNQAFIARHQLKQPGGAQYGSAIAAIIARGELLEHGFDKLNRETIDRIAMVALMAYDADVALEFQEFATRHVGNLASMLQCTAATATLILTRYAELMMCEVDPPEAPFVLQAIASIPR